MPIPPRRGRKRKEMNASWLQLITIKNKLQAINELTTTSIYFATIKASVKPKAEECQPKLDK
jgi:hypothetical protein